MYFDFRTYFKVVWLVLTDKPSPKRLVAHLGILALLTSWAVCNALFLLLDRLLYPGCGNVEIRNPIFVIGNGRSGTTFFHRLLCGDEERFISFTLWEILFPSLVQKRILRALFRTWARLLPRSFQRAKDWEGRQLGSLKAQRPIGIDDPDEDDFLLMIPFASPVITALFPYMEELEELARFDQRPEAARRGIMGMYRQCVSRQLAFHGVGKAGDVGRAGDGGEAGPRTFLSKNPSFVARIRSLGEEFPDAKFIYLIRNPYETIPSLLKLLNTVWTGLGLESDHIESSTRQLARGCMEDYNYAFEELRKLPDERYAVVSYTDLVADPKATVEKVYDRLNLSISPDFERRLAAERSRQKRYHSSNVYSLEEFGVSPEEVAERLSDLIARFGFRPEDVPENETREML
ncbi:MAG: sulfotransferase [Deltaproteobacteria bacterium]|nr:sulfotransferase [Deltaproteobacteria bacterium]